MGAHCRVSHCWQPAHVDWASQHARCSVVGSSHKGADVCCTAVLPRRAAHGRIARAGAPLCAHEARAGRRRRARRLRRRGDQRRVERQRRRRPGPRARPADAAGRLVAEQRTRGARRPARAACRGGVVALGRRAGPCAGRRAACAVAVGGRDGGHAVRGRRRVCQAAGRQRPRRRQWRRRRRQRAPPRRPPRAVAGQPVCRGRAGRLGMARAAAGARGGAGACALKRRRGRLRARARRRRRAAARPCRAWTSPRMCSRSRCACWRRSSLSWRAAQRARPPLFALLCWEMRAIVRAADTACLSPATPGRRAVLAAAHGREGWCGRACRLLSRALCCARRALPARMQRRLTLSPSSPRGQQHPLWLSSSR